MHKLNAVLLALLAVPVSSMAVNLDCIKIDTTADGSGKPDCETLIKKATEKSSSSNSGNVGGTIGGGTTSFMLQNPEILSSVETSKFLHSPLEPVPEVLKDVLFPMPPRMSPYQRMELFMQLTTEKLAVMSEASYRASAKGSAELILRNRDTDKGLRNRDIDKALKELNAAIKNIYPDTREDADEAFNRHLDKRLYDIGVSIDSGNTIYGGYSKSSDGDSSDASEMDETGERAEPNSEAVKREWLGIE